MNPPPREIRDAFRVLERRLAARRFRALDVRMRVALLLFLAYLVAFAYSQTRVPLDGIRRAHGEPAAAWALAGILAALALLGAIAAAWQRAGSAERAPGPEWLALPVAPQAVRDHLRREAVRSSLGLIPVALAVLAAGAGLVAPLHLAALAVGAAVLWRQPARLAVMIPVRASRTAARTPQPLPAAIRELLPPGGRAGARPHRAPRWRSEPAWRAIARLDGALPRHRSATRTRLLLAAACFAACGAAWFAPAPPLTCRALSYLAFACGAACLGSWAIARTCSDPPSVLRPLPLRVRDIWRARSARVALVLAAVSALDAALAWPLPPAARAGVVLTFLPSGLAIALLGVNYGITLAPRARIAESLYVAWLYVAMAASWMIPLLGWGVLAAGLVHSGMRLSRAPRMEVN